MEWDLVLDLYTVCSEIFKRNKKTPPAELTYMLSAVRYKDESLLKHYLHLLLGKMALMMFTRELEIRSEELSKIDELVRKILVGSHGK